MDSDLKVELTARALFLLFDVLEQYMQEGYETEETIARARERLEGLNQKIQSQKPLPEGPG